MTNRKEVTIIDLILIILLSYLIVLIPMAALTYLKFNMNVAILTFVTDIVLLSILLYKLGVSKNSIDHSYKDFVKKINYKEIFGVYITYNTLNFALIMLFAFSFMLLSFSVDDTANLNMISDGSSSIKKISENIFTINNTLSIISTIVIAPVLEEIMFRKIIFKRLSKKYTMLSSIIISSIIFALVHKTGSMFSTFLSGTLYCILYIKYKNILIPMFLHFLNNLISTVASMAGFKITLFDNILSSYQNIVIAFAIMLLIAIISLYLFIKYYKDNKKYFNNENRNI